jgi:uncharacterized membrane protein
MKLFYRGPPLKELHEEYAKKGLLDENAPVKSVDSITTDAPVATVWRLIIDMPNWPEWRSDAHVTKLGAIEPDARFRWKIRGASIKARVRRWLPRDHQQGGQISAAFTSVSMD